MMKVFMSVGMILLMVSVNMNLMFYMNLMFILSFILMFSYYSGLENGLWSISGSFSLSEYSFFLILLSAWVVGLMILSLLEDNNKVKEKLIMIIIILLILIMFFSSMNLLVFYFFFEVSLIPTFFLVYYWGNNLERLEASFYLLMYMLFISLPLLIYLVKMYEYNFSLDMSLMKLLGVDVLSSIGGWDFFIIFGAFFIKLPIYLFHVWLPKAHVEAPVWGSMLLAAILLKLGGYGVLRLIHMFVMQCYMYGKVVVSVTVVGTLYSSVLCLVQVDLKSLVAYSSIVHMNLMLSGIFTLVKLSIYSALIVMISHGLCSSGLFYMVNMYYQRSGSRLLILNKGYVISFSSGMIWWFLLCSSNFSFPFSLNFVGEITLMMVLLGWWGGFMVPLMLICFFSGAYCLYMYSMVSHDSGGGIKGQGESDKLDVYIEHLGSLMHYVPLLLIMLNLGVFIK